MHDKNNTLTFFGVTRNGKMILDKDHVPILHASTRKAERACIDSTDRVVTVIVLWD